MTRQVKPAASNVSPSPTQILATLERLAADAQDELAGRIDAGADVLGYLARQGGPSVRRAVAANAAAPHEANRHLADDPDDDVRVELARKIGRLMPGLAQEESRKLRQLTIDTLERLAHDQLPRVRAILAEEIKSLDCVPEHIVQVLARDAELTVAAPVLEYSPLLSDADLMEIVATAKAGEALSAIARRKYLSANVSDAIVTSLDIPAVAALLANPDAKVREKTLDSIVEDAKEIRAWHQPLAMRADLSQRAIRRIASFVGLALIETLSQRRGLDEKTRLTLGRKLRERLNQDDCAHETQQRGQLAVARALKLGQLDDKFVEEAAKVQERDTVIAALAALNRLPEEVVSRILQFRSAKPITALVWRGGLGMRAAFKIQRFIMHLPVDELLPAREGVRFPLSDEEMRWHLGYFGVAA